MNSADGRRGPKPRTWYETWVKHALRHCGDTRALARNKLCELPALIEAADELPPDQWQPEAYVLRGAIKRCVQRVLELVEAEDRRCFEVLLAAIMRGESITAVAKQLGYCRETVQRTWWPEAVRAVTIVFIQNYTRRG